MSLGGVIVYFTQLIFTSIMFWEKDVRVFWNLRTSFPENMYVFFRNLNGVIYMLNYQLVVKQCQIGVLLYIF